MSRSGFNSEGAPFDSQLRCGVEACNGVDDDCDGLTDEGCNTACGTLGHLLDDFDDATRGPAWDVTASGAVTGETDGTLALRPTTANGRASYVSNEALVVMGGAVTVEVVEMVDLATDAQGILNVVRYGEGAIEFRQTHGRLFVELLTDGGGSSVVASVPYDPEAHRWWRLAFDGSDGSADVSRDGETWTLLGTFTPPFTPDLAHVSLIADAAGTSFVGQVRFDNFNGTGTGDLSNCPILELDDDFNDGVLGPLWDKSFATGGASVIEAAGDVVLSPPPNAVGGAGLFATNRYDLRGDSITVRVTQVLATSPGNESVLRLVSGSNEGFFLARNNRLLAEVVQSGSNVLADIPYDPSVHRCLRFRESGGVLFWETAGGQCTTFTTMASMPVTFDLGSVSVIAFAQAFAAVPSPGSMHIDSVSSP